MKNLILSGLLAILLTSTFSYAVEEGARYLQSEEAVKSATYGHIDARALKNLMDANVPFILLDARGKKWNDKNIIPGAKQASYEYSLEELQQIIPNFDTLVVVYGYSFTCPLSRKLADRLIECGYHYVIEYPGGLKEWRDVANYSVNNIEA